MKNDVMIEIANNDFDDLMVTNKTEANNQSFYGILFIIYVQLYD